MKMFLCFFAPLEIKITKTNERANERMNGRTNVQRKQIELRPGR